MYLSGLDLWLWLAGLTENVVLLSVLWKCRRAPDFPVFTTWVTLLIAKSVLLFGVYKLDSAFAHYYYTYVCLNLIDVLLQIALAYEVALHVFRPAGTWAPGVRHLFLWGFATVLLLSSALSWLALPSTKYLTDTLLVRGNFLSATLMSAVFVGLLVLSARLGLAWRTHVAKLSQGFGLYSVVCTVAASLHTYFGMKPGNFAFHVISRSRMVVYLLTALFWIVSFVRAAPAERPMPEHMRLQLVALNHRTASLLTALRGVRRA